MFVIVLGLCILAALYSLAVIATVLLQRRMIFFPEPMAAAPFLAKTAPGEPLEVKTSDGLSLQCWNLEPADGHAPYVLYLQGNAGNLAYRADRINQLSRLGWGALLMGYRGYGGTLGTPSERALVYDARICLDALAAMAPGRRVVIWGESLGTGIAVQVAAERDIDLLVLEAPFTSLAELARRHFGWLRPALPFLRHRFDSAATIASVHCPVFVLAGDRDRLVTPDMPRRIFALANEPKTILWLKADHNSLGTPAAFDAVAEFFAIRQS